MTFLTGITYMGIVVFALTGAVKARMYKMDVFGGLVVAFVTAYGGETLRDLLQMFFVMRCQIYSRRENYMPRHVLWAG